MLVRIYTGDDGQSHFEDLDLPEPDVQRIATKPGEEPGIPAERRRQNHRVAQSDPKAIPDCRERPDGGFGG